jgi:hypothetical protein
MHTKVWLENLMGRDELGDLGEEEKIILERILGKWGGMVLPGFIWLRIGTSVGHLWTL